MLMIARSCLPTLSSPVTHWQTLTLWTLIWHKFHHTFNTLQLLSSLHVAHDTIQLMLLTVLNTLGD